METILQILQWAIPSGGIGTAIGWFWNRRVSQARSTKEVHDTFKQMYEDVSVLLPKIQNTNHELNEKINELQERETRLTRALNRMSRAIEAIPLCDYHSQCPVLSELRLDQDGGTGGRETSGIRGREDRRKPGGDKPGERSRRGKPGNVTAPVGGQCAAGKGGVQPPGGKHPRVPPEGKG